MMARNNDSFLHFMKVGDTGPPLRRTLIDANNGLPMDLTGASVKLIMTEENGDPKINAAMSIEYPPTAGIVRYDWQTGDSDSAGNFPCEIQVTKLSGEIVTFPPGDFEPGKRYIYVLMTEDLGD